jgi:hypothetical protein
MADKPKFIQITADDGSLYALDDDGDVWEFDGEEEKWCPLADERSNG